MKTYKETAFRLAGLVEDKQIKYGDSFSKCGTFLKLLYPNGVSLDQYNDMLTIVRIFDKLCRVATSKKAYGENPFEDIVGYSLLKIVKDQIDLKENVCQEK